jgi:hypothetical protein
LLIRSQRGKEDTIDIAVDIDIILEVISEDPPKEGV